jgi:hypothetical protein
MFYNALVYTSTQSSNVKKKLDILDMIEDDDYMLLRTEQHRKNGSTHPVNSYMLTPESFKFCLVRGPSDLLRLLPSLGILCRTRDEKKVDSFNFRDRHTANPRAKHYQKHPFNHLTNHHGHYRYC